MTCCTSTCQYIVTNDHFLQKLTTFGDKEFPITEVHAICPWCRQYHSSYRIVKFAFQPSDGINGESSSVYKWFEECNMHLWIWDLGWKISANIIEVEKKYYCVRLQALGVTAVPQQSQNILIKGLLTVRLHVIARGRMIAEVKTKFLIT